jgi:hypothetical protein
MVGPLLHAKGLLLHHDRLTWIPRIRLSGVTIRGREPHWLFILWLRSAIRRELLLLLVCGLWRVGSKSRGWLCPWIRRIRRISLVVWHRVTGRWRCHSSQQLLDTLAGQWKAGPVTRKLAINSRV